MTTIGDTRLRFEPGFQSEGLDTQSADSQRTSLLRQIAGREISVTIGGHTHRGEELAAMTTAQFNRLCGDAGLEPGDVLQLLDDVNLDANRGRVIDLDPAGEVAAATGIADGIEGNYGAVRPLGTALAADAAAGLELAHGRLSTEQVDQPSWVMRILSAIRDAFVEAFGAITGVDPDTYTFNDRPGAAELQRFQQVGLELARAHPEQYAAVLTRPGGREELLQQLQDMRPGDAGWGFAMEQVVAGIEAETLLQSCALDALLGRAASAEVEAAIGGLYATHGADADRAENMAAVVDNPLFGALPAEEQLQVVRGLEACGCSAAGRETALAAMALEATPRSVALLALRTADTRRLENLAGLLGRADFHALAPQRLQAALLRACSDGNFTPALCDAAITAAGNPAFARCEANGQSRALALLARASSDPERLEALVQIFTAPAFGHLSAQERGTTLDTLESGLHDPGLVARVRVGIPVETDLSVSDAQRAATTFGISTNHRARLVGQFQARGITFTYTHEGRTYTLTPTGTHDPARGQVSLQRILAARNPERALADALPGLDARDFGAFLVAVAEGRDSNLTIDISAGSEAARQFGLVDGTDGNAAELLGATLSAPAQLAQLGTELQARGTTFTYRHGGVAHTITGQDIHDVFDAEDPAAALAARFPGVSYEGLRSFLGDFSTLGERIVGWWVIDLSSDDFRRSGVLGTGTYDRTRAQRAVRNQVFDEELTFRRGAVVAATVTSTAATASLAQTEAARASRVMVAATSATEPSYDDIYTPHLAGQIRRTGRLGEGLYASRAFTYGSDQRATQSGDPRILDAMPPGHVHVLLVGEQNFPGTASDLRAPLSDVRRMRREITRTPGPGIPMDNVHTMTNVSARQAYSGMEALIDRAPAGDAVMLYVSTHGSAAGYWMSDGETILTEQIEALYQRAEARGVRLVFVADSCHSGTQVDAIRETEIQRLEGNGDAHPRLRDMDNVRDGLVSLRGEAQRYGEVRAAVPARLRLFAPSELPSWMGSAFEKDGPRGSYAPGPPLLDQIRADPTQGPRLARLEERARLAQATLTAHDAAPDTAAAPTPEDYAVVEYYNLLVSMSDAIARTETAQCALLSDADGLAANPLAARAVEDPNLLGSHGRLSNRELLNVIDRADEGVTELILASNQPPPSA